MFDLWIGENFVLLYLFGLISSQIHLSDQLFKNFD